jgi:PRC-barrel domain
MAESWIGFELDDRDGNRVGSVHGLYLDVDSGEPVWLVAALGRRRAKLVAIPYSTCAAGAGRVWVAHRREALGAAPGVDPGRPLLREHELAICAHFGIGERSGRAAAVVGRDEGALTARPGSLSPGP